MALTANTNPNPNLVELTRILERHTSIWFSDPVLFDPSVDTEVKKRTSGQVSGECVVCYNNLLSGESSLSSLKDVRKLAGRPLFYRLNYIRQLSTTHLAVDLDGTHNRLSHCLGTLDIASRFVSAIQKQISLDDIEVKAVLWGPVEERVDKHLLLKEIDTLRLLKKHGREADRAKIPLWKEIRSCVAKNDKECEQIFEHLAYFADYSDVEVHDPYKAFLREIVDSDLDADRLDYIWRDHVYLTMSVLPDAAEIEDLICSVKVLENGRGRHLYYDLVHKDLVDSLLSKRVKYYSNFYEHPLKTVADEMLSHALYYALETVGAFGHGSDHEKELGEFADRFAYLTDDGLIQFLAEITSNDDQIVASSLLKDFRTNRTFEIIEKRGLHRQDFGHLTRRIASQQAKLDGIVQEEKDLIRMLARQKRYDFDHTVYREVIEKFNSRIYEPTICENDPDPLWNNKRLEHIPDEDTYHIQLICGDGFRKKFRLEKMLWEKLLTFREGEVHPFVDALNRVAMSMAGSRKGDEEFVLRIKRLLEKSPLIFITLSWIPGSSEEELTNHKRGLSRGGIRFHDNGTPVKQQPELTVRSSDEDYFLLLSAPSILQRVPSILKLIQETFEGLLSGRAWALWGVKAIDETWD